MKVIQFAYGWPKRPEQRMLLTLIFMGIWFYLMGQPNNLITGELNVLIPEGHPTLFVVRNGEQVNTVIVPDNAVERLTAYAGFTVQMRAVASPPSPYQPPSPPPPPPPYRGSRRRPPPKSQRTLMQSRSLVNATSAVPGTKATFVDLIEVMEPADKDFFKNAIIGAQNISSVVFLMSFCGWESALNASSLRALWFNTPSTPSTARTLQNYWANCSQNLAQLDEANQVIVEVKLPCSGVRQGKPYNLSSMCRDTELFAMMDNAEAYARDVLNITAPGIKQRVAVLPKEAARSCPWLGLASVGCTSGTACYTWINGDAATLPTIYMHEMGHNFGLMHSGRRDNKEDEYGDFTCAMGSADSCFNAANLWRMGWAEPLPDGDLNSTSFPAGLWKNFQLPFATQALSNHIRIVTDWIPLYGKVSNNLDVAMFPGYYVSLRTSETFDAFSPKEVPKTGRVLIHSSNVTQVPTSYQRTMLEAVLDAKEIYSAPRPFGIVIYVNGISATQGASVRVCRAEVANESQSSGLCDDGLDNDCDGLTDDGDADCGMGSIEPPPVAPSLPRPLTKPPKSPRSPKTSKPPKSPRSPKPSKPPKSPRSPKPSKLPKPSEPPKSPSSPKPSKLPRPGRAGRHHVPSPPSSM